MDTTELPRVIHLQRMLHSLAKGDSNEKCWDCSFLKDVQHTIPLFFFPKKKCTNCSKIESPGRLPRTQKTECIFLKGSGTGLLSCCRGSMRHQWSAEFTCIFVSEDPHRDRKRDLIITLSKSIRQLTRIYFGIQITTLLENTNSVCVCPVIWSFVR